MLAVASLKMFFRQREAIIWTMMLPVLMIVIFGFVRFDSLGHLEMGVVNEAGPAAEQFIKSLADVKTVDVHNGTKENELDLLQKGERAMVLVIPIGFDPAAGGVLTTYLNDGKQQQAQLGVLILQRLADEFTFQHSPVPNRVTIKTESIKSRNLTYLDFLLPGILSMSIMQMGIFGVAFGFVSLKKRGILRRMWVTPIKPGDFIIAQVAMRLVVVMLQIALIVAVGVIFFDLNFIGSLWQLFAVGMLGAIVFLAIGYALAGISKSEDQVAPMANIIAMPMMFLSGIFFGRSALPGVIHTVTGFFPLTYLADAMRSIAIDGATLIDVGPQLAGLAVWAVITCVIAIKMFRWE